MYTGTLISDLLELVERAERLSGWHGPASGRLASEERKQRNFRQRSSEAEKFSQTPGLSPADRNLGLFLVVHPQLVGTLEPRDDLADAIDVHEVGAMSAPE